MPTPLSIIKRARQSVRLEGSAALLAALCACHTEPADDGLGCRQSPSPPDRVRYVVVSHPYLDNQDPSGTVEVLALDPNGELSATGHTAELAQATSGEVVFTPDGEIGLFVDKEGGVNALRLGPDGRPTVLRAGWTGDGAEPSFYASAITVDPSGERAWIVDGNWRNNGGGLFEVAIDCETGELSEVGRVVESKLASFLLLHDDLPGGALLVADDVLDSETDETAHLLDWPASPAVRGSAQLFPDLDAIASSAALTPDGAYLLVGDNSFFSGVDNRIGIARVDDDGLTALDPLTPLEDPVAILPSPFGSALLVASGFGDALWRISYDPADAQTPFAIEEQVASAGLPFATQGIDRGFLRGLVLVAEYDAVRRLRFEPDGTVTDLDRYDFGEGYASMVGVMGVQP